MYLLDKVSAHMQLVISLCLGTVGCPRKGEDICPTGCVLNQTRVSIQSTHFTHRSSAGKQVNDIHLLLVNNIHLLFAYIVHAFFLD